MAAHVLLYLALLVALFTTGVFAYGAWLLVRHPHSVRRQLIAFARALHLIRDDGNPLMTARDAQDWEAQGVLNPAAVDDEGHVHLFYRAIGGDGVSRVGYASSKDGKKFSRLPYPVFSLSTEGADAAFKRSQNIENYESLVASGGSWAGVEDPRAVVIDDRLYLTFSAFGGWDSLRMGVSSLSMEDLRQQRWKWTPPVYLSPRGQVHKNWVLFPEKINGKFAVLHSLHSGSRERVLVDYLDTLDQEPATDIDSPYAPTTDDSAWDSRVRGAGPPPIKTPMGWLVLYHAIDRRDPSRYKLGAMLLDLHDPSRIIFRSKAPVLSPDAPYENEGAKSGVVYACGAVLRNDLLTVFYGGADSVVCAARHSLSKLLDLVKAEAPAAEPRVQVMGLPHLA
jgi:predicted GH43/DUF377 family glycosyl hydrolase